MIKFKRKSIITTVVFIVLLAACVFYCLSYYNLKNNTNSLETKLKTTEYALSTTNDKLRVAIAKALELNEELTLVGQELDKANMTVADLKSDEYELVYMGDFTLTHYCVAKYEHICGTGDGITATGTVATAGRTVAVDPSVIPYGTQMYVEGYGWRTAEDCGGAVNGNQIDIAVDTHEEAINMGTTSGGVWMLIKK